MPDPRGVSRVRGGKCLAPWVAVVLVVLLGGCAAAIRQSPTPAAGLAVSSIHARVAYVDESGAPLAADLAPPLMLAFPIIPGQIYGRVHKPLLFVVQPDGRHTFSLDLAAKRKQIDALAVPLRPVRTYGGLAVKPASARILRLATFAFYRSDSRPVEGGVGFQEPRSGDALVMIYVDRRCHISGTLREQGLRVEHAIHIPGPGFYWIRRRRVGTNHFLMQQVAPPAHILLRVQLRPPGPI
ncbi:MAG: hypothetical protein P8076_04500 [Gammaproteobacteria bacterium]